MPSRVRSPPRRDAARSGAPRAATADPVSKQSLLLVDGDPRSLRVLEVSLKKAGFNVTTAINGRDALDKVELAPPDLVIAETQLDEIDGFTFCQRLKSNPAWADIPFVFLTAQTDIATKIRGLELGVDDYLTKPIYIKEIVARARILLQKRQRTRIEERRDGRTRFAGHLSDMPIVDLIQTVEISRKSGLIQFVGEGGKQAAIYFRDGKVIDAEAGPLQAEDAVYRMLTWNEGEFEVAFRTVRRRDTITMSAQALLMEGMRRLDEWGRLCEQLPPLETRFEVDARELANRLGEIQDEHNAILRLFDGRRSVLEVIDACDYGDLESLEVIARLYFEGVLVEAGPARPTMSGEWMVPAAAIEAAGGSVATPTTGLVSEDGEEPSDEHATVSPAARTISGEWMLEGDAAADHEATVSPPMLPRTLTPGTKPVVAAGAKPAEVPTIPSLPSVSAARRTLIQKAIDDSDSIAMQQLEEELARHESGPIAVPPVDVTAAAETKPVTEKVPVTETKPTAAKSSALAEMKAALAETKQATEKMPAAAVKTEKAPAETKPVPETKPVTAVKTEKAPAVARPVAAAAVKTEKVAAAVKTEKVPTAAKAEPTAKVEAVASADASGKPLATTEPKKGPPSPPKGTRPLDLVRGSATLVTDPLPPNRTPVGSQRVRVEHASAEPGRNGASAAPEPVPPNRRGSRWPALVTGAVVLAGAVYLIAHAGRTGARRPPVAALALDAGPGIAPIPTVDAAEAQPAIPVDAAAPAVDAAALPPPPDARPTVDTSRPRPPGTDTTPPGSDSVRGRLDAARKLIATDPQAALDQIDQILDEHRSARALLARAEAAQRLGRVDAALSAVGAALEMTPKSATAWELKGRILWAAGRREEGRAAYVRYLELQPTGATADQVRRILGGS